MNPFDEIAVEEVKHCFFLYVGFLHYYCYGSDTTFSAVLPITLISQILPTDPNHEHAMNCGRSSTGMRGNHK